MNEEQLARMCFKILDFNSMRQVLQRNLHSQMDSLEWIKWAWIGLRVYTELGEIDQIQFIQENVNNLLKKEENCPVEFKLLKARFEFEKGNFTIAKEIFDLVRISSQDLWFQNQAKIGCGICFFFLKKYAQALEQFNDLAKTVSDSEIQITSLLWLAHAENAMGNTELSLTTLAKAFYKARNDRNLYLMSVILLARVETYLTQGKFFDAEKDLKLIEDLLPADDEFNIRNQLRKMKDRVQSGIEEKGFNLMESESRTVLKTPDGRIIDFTKQFTLIRLLKTLSSEPGKIFKKETVYEKVWKTPYHPLECDNKIYVTIKRLRRLIESEASKPELILKRDDGYSLNPDVHFKIFQCKYFEQEHQN